MRQGVSGLGNATNSRPTEASGCPHPDPAPWRFLFFSLCFASKQSGALDLPTSNDLGTMKGLQP
jgi:hypothetical protein